MSTFKYFGRRVGICLDNSNHENPSTSCSAWCSNKNHAAVVFYCHVYSHQYVEYLKVDLKGSKAINPKQEKILSNTSCPGWELNPRPFSPKSSTLAYEPSHRYQTRPVQTGFKIAVRTGIQPQITVLYLVYIVF